MTYQYLRVACFSQRLLHNSGPPVYHARRSGRLDWTAWTVTKSYDLSGEVLIQNERAT